MLKLSIIVPVYNVEPYIRPCIESIFKQGVDENDYEVIIVNDGSTDKSMEMVTDIISQHNNIMVINQKNQGLSVARNNGIAASKGEYILMPDSDDLLIENSLPSLLDIALRTKADIVVADFLKMTDEEINGPKINCIRHQETIVTEKTGKELFLDDLNPYECYIWRTLFNRRFLLNNKLSFIPGIFFQDVPFIHECYIKAERCLRTNCLLNIYRVNRLGSATASFNKKKAMDFCTIITKLLNLTQTEGISSNVYNKLINDALSSFYVLLYSTAYHINNHEEKKEAISQIQNILRILPIEGGLKLKIYKFTIRWMPQTFMILRRLYGKIIEDKLFPYVHSSKIYNYFKTDL